MTNYEKSVKQSTILAERAGDLSTIQERHPDWPQLELSFYFAAHGNDKDTEGIAPQLADADILLYEDSPRNEENREIYNQIAVNPNLSRWSVTRQLKGDHSLPMAKGIYKSGKAVGTLDIGKTPEERKISEDIDLLFKLPLPGGVKYEDALYLVRDKYAEIARLQKIREGLMVDNFEEEIDRILHEHPDQKEKTKLNILISMGSFHTQLHHSFAELGFETSRKFSRSPYVYGYRSELERSIAFEKEPSFDLLERAFTEDLLVSALYHVNKDAGSKIKNDDIVTYDRKVISALGSEEMREIYDTADKGNLSIEYIDNMLVTHGHHRLPRNSKELLNEIKDPKSGKGKLAKTAIRYHGR